MSWHQYPDKACVADDCTVQSSWDNVASSNCVTDRAAAQSREAAAPAASMRSGTMIEWYRALHRERIAL
jgi:hypothetical protein